MASSSTSAPSFELNTARGGSGTQQYPFPSCVHAASFVSIKLSGKTNYDRWLKQMMCLIECHGMQGFIDGTLENPKENGDSEEEAEETTVEANYEEWKRSDMLVRGWIFGSLSEDVMGTVVGLQTANDVWKKLKTTYSRPYLTISSDTDRDGAEYLPLCRAILRGDWEKARETFNKDKDTLTAKLDVISKTALHLAIETCKNIEFVENLLKEINPESLPTLVDDGQRTTLHSAVIIGNTKAAKMLVEKNQHLLFIVDHKKYLPIHVAIFISDRNTFRYLLDVSKQHIGLSLQDGYHSPFEGRNGTLLLSSVINEGILDVAYELIKEYPDMARTKYKGIPTPLVLMAEKSDFYYSGTPYNFYQRFVYSHVPIENNSLGNTDKVQDIENQETYKDKVVTRCRRSCFHDGLLSTL